MGGRQWKEAGREQGKGGIREIVGKESRRSAGGGDLEEGNGD